MSATALGRVFSQRYAAVDELRGLYNGATRHGSRTDRTPIAAAAGVGDSIPLVFGRARLPGFVLWSSVPTWTERSGFKPLASQAAPEVVATVAIGLCARPILGVTRIWANNELIRDERGVFALDATYRLHLGSEDQQPDPAIVATEGSATPAFRGLAYIVLEDVRLGAYGNRVPRFEFEVVAGSASVTASSILRDLDIGVDGADLDTPRVVDGFVVAGAVTAADAVADLAAIEGAMRVWTGTRDKLVPTIRPPVVTLTPDDLFSEPDAPRPETTVFSHRPGPGRVTLRYAASEPTATGTVVVDTGLSGPSAEITLPVYTTEPVAKAIARDIAYARDGGGIRRVSVSTRHIALEPGDTVAFAGEQDRWLITGQNFEGIRIDLELIRLPAATRLDAIAADPARSPRVGPLADDIHVHVHDLPLLPGEPDRARVIAAAAVSSGLRREVVISAPGDAFRAPMTATLVTNGVLGFLASPLADGFSDRVESAASCDIQLRHPDMTLLSCSQQQAIDGENVAVIGDEVLQFMTATPRGAGRYTISGLIRGRLGTAPTARTPGETVPFTLLDEARVQTLDVSMSQIDRDILWSTAGVGFVDTLRRPVTTLLKCESLRPLAPVHVRAVRDAAGGVALSWVRRSRLGYSWVDGVDAPIGEEREGYRVVLTPTVGPAVGFEAGETRLALTPSAQLASFGALLTSFQVEVRQLSGTVGLGRAATARFNF